MIYLLIIYLLFQIGYDHWGTDSVVSDVIYFSFQWGWVAAIAFFQYIKDRKLVPFLIGLIFTGLMINELLCFNLETFQYMEAVNIDNPVYGLSIVALALFVLYEIIQWKRKRK